MQIPLVDYGGTDARDGASILYSRVMEALRVDSLGES